MTRSPLNMINRFSIALLVCGLTLLVGCSQTSNLVTVNASWNDDATDFRENNGVRYQYVCPPNPSKTGVGAAWGTDTYSDDSAVCAAAVHAGKITFSGGTVTIEIREGLDSYTGSTRNGVVTQDWGVWTGSFVVL